MTPLRWILLPGLDGTGRLFDRFLARLGDVDAVVVRYPADPAADLDAYAKHAAAAIGDAPRCLVVAESFSGPVALRLQRLDARVEAIVLVASFVRRPHPLLRWLPVSMVAALVRRAASGPLLRMFCLGRDARDESIEALRSVVCRLPATVLSSRLALLRSLDESAALRSTRVPVLHLRALRDRLVFSSLSRNAPPAALFREVVVDGPHFLLQARPSACLEAIVGWAAHGRIGLEQRQQQAAPAA